MARLYLLAELVKGRALLSSFREVTKTCVLCGIVK